MNLIAPVHRIYTAFRALFSGGGKDFWWERRLIPVNNQIEIAAKTELLGDAGGDGFYCIMTKNRCFNGSRTKE